MRNPWQEVLEFVEERIRDPATNLTELATKTGVNIWWLHRIRRNADVVDPGFTKVGRVFMALGGRAPKVPKQEQKNARSDDVSSQ